MPCSKSPSRCALPAAPVAAAADPWRQPQIAGYRLIKTIAQSPAAAVYLARNENLPQPVALKVQAFKGRYEVSDADRQRFIRECEILSSLNHRSIADVLDFGITDDYLYLALGIFSLRQPARPPEESGERGRCSQLRAADRRGAAGAACGAHRAPRPQALESHVDQRQSPDPDRLRVGMHAARGERIVEVGSRARAPRTTCAPSKSTTAIRTRAAISTASASCCIEMLVGRAAVSRQQLGRDFRRPSHGPVPRLPQRVLRYQPIIDRLLAKDPADRYARRRHSSRT